MGQASPQIGYEDFERVDIRIGTVLKAEPFPEARKPAYRLTIDFGPEIGVKTSSAQVTKHYGLEELVGRRVAAVVNFPPRQIASVKSEVLCLGFPDAEGGVVLVDVDRDVPNGGKLF
jgi:tRNA-binding protein